ncbi:DMT family transporter [Ruminococcaceae bacterium OttesenSCG-928-D13]|nr:DMT family transporter [Ruminococcaceae bacterium OttesenSCG-928-D13]
MYYLLSALIGIIVAVMIAVNGELTAWYGVYPATVIIHLVGLVLVLVLVAARRPRLRPSCKLPFYAWLGGAVGVATTVFNNAAFGHISVSALLALGLVGQTVTALAFDHWGVLGTPRRAFNKKKLIGFTLVLAGVAVMLF